jgi:alanyl-tRNA synthetase
MTERLYYEDPSLKRFSARVAERLTWEGQPAVVLDRSAFYPTGGGQPSDRGELAGAGPLGVRVVDVVERESDGAVVHVLAGVLEADEVVGSVDWSRRFDLMQQHTGQHILSAAALECLDANTVGFHLAEEAATIDLDRAPLSAEELAGVEARANAILTEDRPVVAHFVPDDEVASLPLRKPVRHAGPVRIVQVIGFDCSACGGTHVRATGEIGLLKITRSERRGTETRVEFLCGGRALRDYETKHALLMGLAAELTVGHWEVADAVHRMAGDLQEARRDQKRAHDALMDAEAAALWYQAQPSPLPSPAPTGTGAYRLVKAHLPGRTPDDLKHLAQRLLTYPLTVALLGSGGQAGEPGHFVFARSAGLDVSMGALVRQACEVIGGRGGGRPDFAQGGGPDGARVMEALEAISQSLPALLAGR